MTDIRATKANFEAVSEPTPLFRATKASLLALVNFPTEFIDATFARFVPVVGQDIGFEATKANFVVVCKGRTAHPNIVTWTFILHAHEYYVIQTPHETLLYDFHAERWYNWGSGNDKIWNVQVGQNWNANLGALLASDQVSNVLAGDGTTSALYFLDPMLSEDYSSLGVEGKPFQRVVTGQLVTRKINDVQSLPCVDVMSSEGDTVTASNLSVELTYSDDRGHTYNSAGSLDVVLGQYSAALQWRSLGSFRAPGRLLRLTDFGGLRRIDDWTTPDG